MNKHGSDFQHGTDLLKKLMVASLLTAVAALFFEGTMQAMLIGVTMIFFAGALWAIYKHCRCPHCGKVIFAGALSIRRCPRCKRDLYTGKKSKKSR